MAAPGKTSRSFSRRGALGALLTGLVAGLLALWALEAPAVERLEATTLDWRFQLRGPLPPGDQVAVVLLDERSLAALGGWPLARRHLAEAVAALQAAGARTLAFDLLFAPRADPDGDHAFAAAMTQAGNVVLGYAFDFDAHQPREPLGAPGDDRPPAEASLHRFLLPPGTEMRVPHAAGTTLPDTMLQQAAADLGHMTVLLAPDGALRRETLLVEMAGELYPSLALQTARRQLRLPRSELKAVIGRSVSLGTRSLPLDARMRLPVNFYGPAGSFPAHGLVDLLEGRVPADALAGRAVVVGSTALAASPGFVTPFDPALPSVAYTATVLDNLLSGRALLRPDWLRGLELLVAALGAGVAFAVARRLPAAAAPLAAGFPATAWAGLTYLVFVNWHVWLAAVVPVAATVGGAAIGALARSRAEQRRRQIVARERENLSRYFSPAVAERLATRSGPGELTGVQDASVLFVDLVGFTGLCERLPGERAIALLRGFHERVERAVFACGGTLDKYLGDGALAVFGVPEPMADDAARALACAVALQDSLAAWREELAGQRLPPLHIGIGLHHGPVLMGDIGGQSRFEFTVLGDTVNVASRLEGLTRDLGVAIVASEAAIQRARQIGEVPLGFFRHGEVRLRGRDSALAVWVWRPLGGQHSAGRRAAG